MEKQTKKTEKQTKQNCKRTCKCNSKTAEKTEKCKKGARGITPIALIVTIIVLLILAGVTIASLTGENGILSQAQSAKESTKVGRFKEDAKLAYMEVYAENAQNRVYVVEEGELISKLQEPQYGYTIQPESAGSVTGITVKQSGITVNTTTAATVEKADETPAETSTTLTVIPTAGEGTEYYIVDDGGYYKISLTGEAITIGERQETVSGSGSSSPTLTVTNAASLQKLETEVSGLTITVVGRQAGDENITISYEGQTATVKVTVTQTFAVNFYASSTEASATLVKVADGGNALTATNYATAKSAADSAAPEGQVFDKWVLKTAVGANEVGTDATSLLGEVTQDLNVYATFKNLPIAFRNYGEARNTGTYGDAYSIGAINVNGVAIADNWKKFYEDDDFIYVIYGDYYPAAAQTEITDGNAIFAPAHMSSSSFQTASTWAYSVNSGADRTTLLRYLRNNNAYSWDSTHQVDNNGTNGGTYASWDNLKTAIVTATGKSAADITIQGSPDIELWDKSWVAKGNSTIINTSAKTNSNGYKIYGLDSAKNMNTDEPWSTGSVEATQTTPGTGYYDELYFPYRGRTTSDGTNADKAGGYWLASPGSYNLNNAITSCGVNSSGNVSCNNGSGTYAFCARPVIAIAK